MVLADLGKQLNNALGQLSRASVVDDKVIEALLKQLCSALLESDVNVKLVGSLRAKVRAKIKKSLEAAEENGTVKESNKKQIVQKAVFDELVALVDPEQEPFKPVKGKTNVLMAVGIQGAGKTTTCTKLAVHYQRKGFRTCLVCADTFRAGAFDQLKQNATKAKIPFYGSYTETDPVSIASQGVSKFRKERFDMIIVDTSGRHKQESELFKEMVAIGDAVKPDMTIMVLDASIGQAAEAQSQAFKESSDFGAIIVTKLDGHAKGGGAISAVAATKTPIIFLGVGEHFNDLERFSPQPFISKLLGMGDMQGLFEHMQDVAMANPDKQKAMRKKLEEGKFALRDWREQLSTLMNMGSMSKIMGSIPGLGAAMEGMSDEDTGNKLKRMIYIMDSMRADELDSDGLIFMRLDKDGLPYALNKRANRVARGSGTSVKEVEELLAQARAMRGIAKMAGGMANASKQDSWAKAAQQMQSSGQRPNAQQIQAMQKAMPPDLLRAMRSAGSPQAAEKVMKEYMAKNGGNGGMDMNAMMQAMMGGGGGGMPSIPGMPDMSQMMNMMGGGGGGMPDMSQMMNMMGGGGGGGGMPNLDALRNMMGMGGK